MNKYKFQVGQNYKIRFYDHAIGSKDLMVCETEGWVLEDKPEHVLLTYWQVINSDEQVKRDNVEPISIIKSCIIRVRKLP